MASVQTSGNNPNDEPTLQLPPGTQSEAPTLAGSEPLISVRCSDSADGETVLGECGAYELLKELGRGGMGVVYKARDKKLRRLVALKMVLAGKLASADDLHRFKTEAEAAARLEHPHIVTVYEVGEADGQHYLSMKYIAGQTLAQRLSDGPLPSRNAARYVHLIARAVHHAHQHGILHRDLKPSNIIVDGDDQPHVTDFGLAKRLGATEGKHTLSGSVLGTPSYMAPEQAQGKTRDLGAGCDIYGLGAVLYELLTGRPPFRAETPMDTLLQVLQNDPVPPRLLNPRIDPDLETICLKCLEKEPAARYRSAQELADDLFRYLSGDSIQARSFNILDRITRTLDRSQHDVAFRTWSGMLLLLAGIVLAEHVAVFFLTWFQVESWVINATRVLQFVLIGCVFWHKQGDHILPRSSAERELWTIWLGYLITYFTASLVVRSLIQNQILIKGLNAPDSWDDLIVYPFSSLLSGLAFFIMGANYWGKCYAIGGAFMVLAIITTWYVPLAPLLFGVLWAFALGSLARRMQFLAARAQEEKEEEKSV